MALPIMLSTPKGPTNLDPKSTPLNCSTIALHKSSSDKFILDSMPSNASFPMMEIISASSSSKYSSAGPPPVRLPKQFYLLFKAYIWLVYCNTSY